MLQQMSEFPFKGETMLPCIYILLGLFIPILIDIWFLNIFQQGTIMRRHAFRIERGTASFSLWLDEDSGIWIAWAEKEANTASLTVSVCMAAALKSVCVCVCWGEFYD